MLYYRPRKVVGLILSSIPREGRTDLELYWINRFLTQNVLKFNVQVSSSWVFNQSLNYFSVHRGLYCIPSDHRTMFKLSRRKKKSLFQIRISIWCARCHPAPKQSQSYLSKIIFKRHWTISTAAPIRFLCPCSPVHAEAACAQRRPCTLPSKYPGRRGFLKKSLFPLMSLLSPFILILAQREGNEILFFFVFFPQTGSVPGVWCASPSAGKPASKPGVCPQVLSSEFPLTPASGAQGSGCDACDCPGYWAVSGLWL